MIVFRSDGYIATFNDGTSDAIVLKSTEQNFLRSIQQNRQFIEIIKKTPFEWQEKLEDGSNRYIIDDGRTVIIPNSIEANRHFKEEGHTTFHATTGYAYEVTNVDKIIDAIRQQQYKEAKTMKSIPHSYCLRYKFDSCDVSWEDVVQFIRDNGYGQSFYGKEYFYYELDGYKYWTMGAPLSVTIALNKAKI